MSEDRTICVDIDGVIATLDFQWKASFDDAVSGIVAAIDREIMDSATPQQRYEASVPVPGAIAALNRLRAQGWHIHLYTGRHINHAETTQDWLHQHGIPFDVIAYGKPPARLYIDDRAVRFTNWDEMVETIENLQP